MGRSTTIDEFISKAVDKFGSKYDYSSVRFIKMSEKIEISCPKHGVFKQTASCHLSSVHGCTYCGNENASSNKVKNSVSFFITKAINIHGNTYDYSNVKYTSSKDVVKIICLHHGEFEQKPSTHLSGAGCPDCGRDRINQIREERSSLSFVSKAISVHGLIYDYSNSVYVKSSGYIKIRCQKHGEFEQVANSHLAGAGCHKCGVSINGNRVEFKEFKEKVLSVRSIHKVIIDSKWKGVNFSTVLVKCAKHGFVKSSSRRLWDGAGCPKCKGSMYEQKVDNFLTTKGYFFKREFSFSDCRHKAVLKFDFFLPNEGILIEVQGEQHFRAVDVFGGEKRFLQGVKRDKIKREYVDKRKNLELLCVSYKDIKNDSFKHKITSKVDAVFNNIQMSLF